MVAKQSKIAHRLALILVVLIPLIALYPIVQTFSDWIAVSRILDSRGAGAISRSYDWIVWADNDGSIEATYVHPSSPAANAGLRKGDSFYMLDFQQYFNAEDLPGLTESRRAGVMLNYTVIRGTEQVDSSFPITRYPTFLYPTSATLWNTEIQTKFLPIPKTAGQKAISLDGSGREQRP